MKILAAVAVATTVALPHLVSAQAPGACAAEGNVQLICGQAAAEDLIQIPGTDWILASSLRGNEGGIRLVNRGDRTISTLYPAAGAKDSLDRKTYGACPGPVEPEERVKFNSHGLSLVAGQGATYRLYAVHHGKRESIEVFQLDAGGKTPSLTWIGCAVAPENVTLNSVVGLDDGGFLATNIEERGPGQPAARVKMMVGELSGDILEWHPGKNWEKVPGSEASGANGLELSKDGKWLYVGAWGNRSFMRLSRGITPPKRDVVPLGFRVDNLRWAPDGTLFAAGQGEKTSIVVKVDPATLKVSAVVNQPDSAAFGASSVAIQVGNEIWVGAYRSNNIAIFPASK